MITRQPGGANGVFFFEIKDTMDLCVSRNCWVDMGQTNKVDDQESLLDEEIPSIGRKTRISTSLSRDEVQFECLDCTFSKVGVVITGGSNLDVKIFTAEREKCM